MGTALGGAAREGVASTGNTEAAKEADGNDVGSVRLADANQSGAPHVGGRRPKRPLRKTAPCQPLGVIQDSLVGVHPVRPENQGTLE